MRYSVKHHSSVEKAHQPNAIFYEGSENKRKRTPRALSNLCSSSTNWTIDVAKALPLATTCRRKRPVKSRIVRSFLRLARSIRAPPPSESDDSGHHKHHMSRQELLTLIHTCASKNRTNKRREEGIDKKLAIIAKRHETLNQSKVPPGNNLLGVSRGLRGPERALVLHSYVQEFFQLSMLKCSLPNVEWAVQGSV